MAVTDSDLREIFANAPRTKTYLEIITLKADWFSQDYHLQNKVCEDLEIEIDGETVDVLYAPMSLGQSSSNQDLNFERNVTIQMVNDIIGAELANFDPSTHSQPTLESRGYVYYRDGTISDLKTPVVSLPIDSIDRDEQGTSFTASTTPTDDLPTGEVATLVRVPMLRGYL